MKNLSRILLVIFLIALATFASDWHASSSTTLGAVQLGFERVFNFKIFNIGSLLITPLFLIKSITFIVLLTLVSHFTRRILNNRILAKTTLDEGLKYALTTSVGYLIYFVGGIIGLQSLGLDLSSVTLLGGAVGIGVGVGLQPIVNNFVSGLIILAERPIKVGDRIEIENLNGDIVQIAARSTWVRTNDNVVIIVPNSEFTSSRVTNWTANDRSVRLTLDVGTSYSSDPEEVRRLLLKVAFEHPDVLTEPAPDVIFTEFGDSSLNFQLRVWTMNQVRTPQILKSDLYFAIFNLFKLENIEIPFPQRDLHVRSISMPIPFTRQQALE